MNISTIAILSGPVNVDGPSSRAFDLSRGLALRGLNVELLTPGGPMVPKFLQAGVPVFLHRSTRAGWLNSLCRRPLMEHIRELAPQVIHCLSPGMSPLAARLARAARCVYVVSTNSRAEAALSTRRSSRFRGIIACDEDVRGHLVNHEGVAKRLISVIPDGIDVDDAPPPASDKHAPVVGMIAPLQKGEGVECFLSAAQMLTERHDDVQFVVAGAGPLRRHLRRLAADLGIGSCVTFTWKFGEYRNVLGALDVLVAPSLHDANTRLVLEAIACRKPVIATGVGCLPGIIKDGETGMLVHKNNPQEIANAVTCLLTCPGIAERIVADAARWVHERHHISQMIEHTLEVYDRAVNRDMR